MIASDILISDYSSIFFDYSIMDKAMFHFTYDYDKYEAKRGVYFDIRDYVSGGDNEDELMNCLRNISYSEEVKRTRKFREKYINFYGDAARQTVDYIARAIDA
jgi:CDP-glycerol glycerophosphotransferase